LVLHQSIKVTGKSIGRKTLRRNAIDDDVGSRTAPRSNADVPLPVDEVVKDPTSTGQMTLIKRYSTEYHFNTAQTPCK
jgi:iron complex outermembrane receptor protein